MAAAALLAQTKEESRGPPSVEILSPPPERATTLSSSEGLKKVQMEPSTSATAIDTDEAKKRYTQAKRLARYFDKLLCDASNSPEKGDLREAIQVRVM